MNRTQFIRSREDRWSRLQQLAAQARKGALRDMSGRDILEIGSLYRAVSSDLAVARRDYPDDRMIPYLNELIAGVYPIVYGGAATRLSDVRHALRYALPQAYRESGRYIALAVTLFAIPMAISLVLVLLQSHNADLLTPGAAQSQRAVLEQHHLWVRAATDDHSVAASFIMTNNIKVALLALTGGLTAGILSLYVMVENGIALGTTGALVSQYGLSGQLWSFVVAHGVIELSVVWMSGGAGLRIADSFLRPGAVRRRDAVAATVRATAPLMIGSVPLLACAGIIESYVSPSSAPVPVKVGVGLLTGVLLYGYLLGSRPHQPAGAHQFADPFTHLLRESNDFLPAGRHR
ncbi:MAG: stage II sporulation protein M [Chloroflexota bacterium]